ncbi:VOC family protein [Oharaeibacter diazotrophicus]|uniref:Glyoxalase-like protein n=1 Tax=Oharaeibacter diazotrophicus TaxID=1920512 RepID=A0A4R6RLM0_9HYPH|nr:VOC family protein [Oharaeibacter diazotrophicus]TDP87015.1 glyoxalase-like protein [Oharaeibacter diazotrophicus]BBE71042.1 hypothetical protein OHA_1_00612 [Pleomorphomonas sp. SM30]GLS77792.1 hypothetical protein GCM10007904_31290 [Oharaeibacter diazotrophicus]
MIRGIDHLVLAVRDLSAARDFYAGLGFTTTPVARHPWGTENVLVQFDGAFLELLAVADAAAIPEHGPGRFSFGAFARDAVARGEGCAMLVLDSADETADRADFAARGLPLFEPFRFERIARRPDGTERTVAFSLTFTASPEMPEIGFFTCRQHYPENFWNPAFQTHANGCTGVDAVILAAADPAAVAPFLAAFAGGTAREEDGAVVVETARGRLEVETPAALATRYGAAALPADAGTPRIVAIRFRGAGNGSRVVPASAAFGTTLILPR